MANQTQYVRFDRQGAAWHVLERTYNTWRSPRRTQTRVVSACGREYDAGKVEITTTPPQKLCRYCPKPPGVATLTAPEE